MESFVIIATPRFGGKGFPVCEIKGAEDTVVNEAIRIFRKGTMHRVIVVDSALKIVFKDTRKCKCTNVQKELTEAMAIVDKCMECGLVINHQGYMNGVPPEDNVVEEATGEGEDTLCCNGGGVLGIKITRQRAEQPKKNNHGADSTCVAACAGEGSII